MTIGVSVQQYDGWSLPDSILLTLCDLTLGVLNPFNPMCSFCSNQPIFPTIINVSTDTALPLPEDGV